MCLKRVPDTTTKIVDRRRWQIHRRSRGQVRPQPLRRVRPRRGARAEGDGRHRRNRRVIVWAPTPPRKRSAARSPWASIAACCSRPTARAGRAEVARALADRAQGRRLRPHAVRQDGGRRLQPSGRGPMTAELLGLPCITAVAQLKVTAGRAWPSGKSKAASKSSTCRCRRCSPATRVSTRRGYPRSRASWRRRRSRWR